MTTQTSLDSMPVEPPAGCPFEPPEELTHLRTEAPIAQVTLEDGSWAWLVTGRAELHAILSDPRASSDPTKPGYPVSGSAAEGNPNNGGLIRTDPPEHTRLRKMVTREFMVKRMEAWRPRIQELAEELCDSMEQAERPLDLVRELALPLPSLAIGLLLGVPKEDNSLFQGATATLVSRSATVDERNAARNELLEYLDGLVTAKEQQPGEDVLSRLIVEQKQAGELTHREVLVFATLLLGAGHETTANMIGLSALTLMRDPETAERLRQDPSLIPGAVEELLRFHSIVRSGPRRAILEDIEIGDHVLRAGEGVICALHPANRDPQTFDDPDDLDVTRPNSRHHLAFGHGIHQCLGQTLARIELHIVLETLLRRFPSMRPAAELDEIPFRSDMLIYGCHSLPVTW